MNLLALIGPFAYGCVMTLILVVAQDALLNAVLGKDWRSAPERPAAQAVPQEAHG